MTEPEHLVLHASAVKYEDVAVVVTGPSRSGKSTLALELMALGAVLVADDLVVLQRSGRHVRVSPPPDSPAGIEASGIGILAADRSESAQLELVVDLGQRESDRLPPFRKRELLGIEFDLVRGAGNRHLAPAVMQYLKCGRSG